MNIQWKTLWELTDVKSVALYTIIGASAIFGVYGVVVGGIFGTVVGAIINLSREKKSISKARQESKLGEVEFRILPHDYNKKNPGAFYPYSGVVEVGYDKIFTDVTVHELRHAKNSEVGYTNTALNEISANAAGYIAGLAGEVKIDNFSAHKIGRPSYNINYVMPENKIWMINTDSLLEPVVSDWENTWRKQYLSGADGIRKAWYKKIHKLFGKKTVFEKKYAKKLNREQIYNHLFTYIINGRPVNLWKNANADIKQRIENLEKEASLGATIKREIFGIGRY